MTFEEVCEEFGDAYGATVASDGSYLYFDTNTLDLEDYSNSSNVEMVLRINRAFGLPESVYQKMLNTTALQGVQNQTYNGITVQWTYHPDKGLEIIYEKN